MPDFGTGGKILEDPRLTLSGTTEAGKQQYRMWGDSETILIPAGQSTTKPLMPENIQANVKAFGDITQGYFGNLIAEFRNTVDYKLFDRLRFLLYRDYENWPEGIDPEEIGIKTIDMDISITFSITDDNDITIEGYSNSIIPLHYYDNKQWISDVIAFGNYNSMSISGHYILATVEVLPFDIGYSYNTPQVLTESIDKLGYPLYLFILDETAHIGNTDMIILGYRNDGDYNIKFETDIKSKVSIKGGY